jgi:hypothetical protein
MDGNIEPVADRRFAAADVGHIAQSVRKAVKHELNS